MAEKRTIGLMTWLRNRRVGKSGDPAHSGKDRASGRSGKDQASPPDPRPKRPDLRLDSLEPEQISGLLGRWLYQEDPDPQTPMWRRFRPRTRFFLIGMAAAAIFLCVAYLDGGLTNPAGVRTAIGLIINPAPRPARISLAVLQDPVALVTIAISLLTPILFAEQVSAIQRFNVTNECNISYRADTLACERINHEVLAANDHFRGIGDKAASAAVLALSAALSTLFIYLFTRWGPYTSWNKTDLPTSVWRHRVYAGWWANLHSHLVLAIALWCLGCYFFYFVTKQVIMGAYFAIYVHRISARKFGVCPNLRVNTDGFWGLLPMRRFMQATYSSALGHTIMVLGILVVWLPFNAFTVFMLTVLITVNAMVVIYPSAVGFAQAYSEKTLFIEDLLKGHQEPTADEAAVIERVWASQTLPFRPGSALTALTIYLLFPLLLAIASKLLGG